MKTVFDILFFPASILIEAIVGVLYPVENTKMRSRRRWALISLAGSIGVFGLVFLLATVAPQSLAITPLVVVGFVFIVAFLIAGKACSDEAEKSQHRDSS